MEKSKSKKQFYSDNRKEIVSGNQSLESLDLEGVLTLTEQTPTPLRLFHLSAESNLEISNLGLQFQANSVPSDNTEYLKKIDIIKHRWESKRQRSDLLSRGTKIKISDTHLIPSTQEEIRQTFQLPEKKRAEQISDLQNILISDIQENIRMAEEDKEMFTGLPPETEDTSKSEEEENGFLDSVQVVGQKDSVSLGGTTEERTHISVGESAGSPSNLGISHLYGTPAIIPTRSATSPKGAIPKHTIQIKQIPHSERVRVIPRLRLEEDTNTEHTSAKVTTSKELETDMHATLISGFATMGTMINDLQTDQAKILMIMESVVSKIDTLDMRLKDVELSMSVLKGVVGTLDADIKNLSIKQKVVTPTIQERAPPTMQVPAETDAQLQRSTNIKETEKAARASAHYQDNLSHLNLRGLNEQVFVQAHLTGGIKSFFQLKYPNNHEVDVHLDAVDSGDAAEYHYHAIDRAILRLESSLHKTVYLAVDPTVARYPGLSARGEPIAPLITTGSNKLPDDPTSLFSHVRTVYR